MPELNSHVLEDLKEQLHRANAHFHRCREEWEAWMDGSEYRHQERVDAARDRLREAEREVEAIEEKIKMTLGTVASRK